ncbi:uncharacterized protein M6B38_124005 [Iris pallida]|uniref:Reverse transcriptase zinc-binding domain-containing protein n=1 Tax=Iris pallida TaxID=29817 RepID=A0AAX6H385_IRIPA|nr:uncharacterized protein M6B38_124005 [Iris pallida]
MVPLATIRKIEGICAKFIWHGGIHAISWEQLCRPRKEGGVGLRSLVSVREAAGIKLAWRFLQGGSLWSAWMSSRYLRGRNFWVCEINNNFSASFKHILRNRPVLRKAIRRKMREGGETDLWLDPWISGQSLLEILGPQTDGAAYRGLTCRHIISGGVWRPEEYRFTAQLGGEIRQVQITPAVLTDVWVWAPPGSTEGAGEFRFSSCYDLVRSHFDEIEEYDFIWGKGLARKMQLSAYKLVLGRMLTRDRLLRFGIPVPDPKCVLCEIENESIGHLFFQCHVAWSIWAEQSRKYLGGVGRERDFREILKWIGDCRGQEQSWARRARLRLAASVWHVWRERNRHIYEGLSTPPVGILHNIESDVLVMSP